MRVVPTICLHLCTAALLIWQSNSFSLKMGKVVANMRIFRGFPEDDSSMEIVYSVSYTSLIAFDFRFSSFLFCCRSTQSWCPKDLG